MIWANLLHLGMNMWCDRPTKEWPPEVNRYITAASHLRFSEPLWNQLIKKMANAGMNMVVIDLGEGVRYQSHPELAVKGSWSVTKLKRELKKLRAMGIEPIPKLNFFEPFAAWRGCIYHGVETGRHDRSREGAV